MAHIRAVRFLCYKIFKNRKRNHNSFYVRQLISKHPKLYQSTVAGYGLQHPLLHAFVTVISLCGLEIILPFSAKFFLINIYPGASYLAELV